VWVVEVKGIYHDGKQSKGGGGGGVAGKPVTKTSPKGKNEAVRFLKGGRPPKRSELQDLKRGK